MFKVTTLETVKEMAAAVTEKKPTFVFTFYQQILFSSTWDICFVSGDEVFHYNIAGNSDDPDNESKLLYEAMEKVGSKEVDGLFKLTSDQSTLYMYIRPDREEEELYQKSFDSWVEVVSAMEIENAELRFFELNGAILSDLIIGNIHVTKAFEIEGERTFEEAKKKLPKLEPENYTEILSWLNFLITGED